MDLDKKLRQDAVLILRLGSQLESSVPLHMLIGTSLASTAPLD